MERISKIVSGIAQFNINGQIVEKQPFKSKSGGSCDVFTAWSNKHQMKVAVKQFREFKGGNSNFDKRLANEILVWTSLKHENILPFLGYFTAEENRMPSLVSEWMAKGTLTDYMKTFPICTEETLRLLRGVASGLAYLHDNHVVHADLKSGNILISGDETPLLADFGLSFVASQSSSSRDMTTSSSTVYRGTMRWMAQEFFMPSKDDIVQKHDKATDIWSYGMIVYELLTLKVPYAEKHDCAVLIALSKGELPTKPEPVGDLKVFNLLWKLCLLCWGERSTRPTVAKIFHRLSPPFETPKTIMETALSLGLTLSHGRFSDMTFVTSRGVYKARCRESGCDLAIKALRVVASDPREMTTEATDCITFLSGLSHPNVLSLLGFYCEGFEFPNFYVVSEWMENWNVTQFMARFAPGGDVKCQIAVGVASGLSYLLSKGLFYVQLRCESILVSSSGHPLLSKFYDDDRGGYLMDLDLRWMSPERLYASLVFDTRLKIKFPLSRPCQRSLVWALGMAFQELLTGKIPYFELHSDEEAQMAILNGRTPTLKADQNAPSVCMYEDRLRSIALQCLSLEPANRPTPERVLLDLKS